MVPDRYSRNSFRRLYNMAPKSSGLSLWCGVYWPPTQILQNNFLAPPKNFFIKKAGESIKPITFLELIIAYITAIVWDGVDGRILGKGSGTGCRAEDVPRVLCVPSVNPLVNDLETCLQTRTDQEGKL